MTGVELIVACNQSPMLTLICGETTLEGRSSSYLSVIHTSLKRSIALVQLVV